MARIDTPGRSRVTDNEGDGIDFIEYELPGSRIARVKCEIRKEVWDKLDAPETVVEQGDSTSAKQTDGN